MAALVDKVGFALAAAPAGADVPADSAAHAHPAADRR